MLANTRFLASRFFNILFLCLFL